MQETTNNVMTSLLEQQTIANTVQRDALVMVHQDSLTTSAGSLSVRTPR